MTLLGARALVVLAAGVMAGGFLGWRAGLLVATLVALTYVLLATVAPRLRAPYGRGRLLRGLQRRGYHVIPGGMARHLAVGPGGVYLLETRVWRHALSRGEGNWWIGAEPAERAVERIAAHAARIERLLGLPDMWAGVSVVPLITVAGPLPEPVMRSGTVVVARPRAAVRHILGRPRVLDEEEVEAIARGASERSPEL
ncbi:hypothetical protein ACQEU5_06555 [Marinactinospora thermotolerans]|uniref:hypothetical protein n=1 Tax=Marinactinospora thermotolerans TaxID=531310 RepID=UPI001F270091|nr:hypothetical protein [Marinactinospora thermotolerans]